MLTTVPPRDGEALNPATSPQFVLTDETVLRRFFLVKYDALLADARTALGAGASELAPKVVEGAFVRAWESREHFTSDGELQTFLVEDLRHAAARALSRRVAAHRLGGAGARTGHETIAPNAEESWGHVLHALHGEAHSPEALAKAAAISRHEAAAHISEMSKERPWWIPASIVAVAIAVLIGLGFMVDRLSRDSRVATALAASEARVITSPTSQLGTVTLDDGSQVHLAPESKLTIPNGFGPKLRAVKLDGMATFDVAKSADRAFEVHAPQGVIVATGTSFTVRSYADDPYATVVVNEGTVELRQGDTRTTAAAGDALVLVGSAARKATAEERDAADAWRRGILQVSNEPLRNVLPLMKRWYGLTIVAKDTTLLAHKVSMRASLESSRQAISAIEQSAGVTFGYVGQNMVFFPATSAAAKK
jgi:transmembrane sensor